jgi:hypothetical protein
MIWIGALVSQWKKQAKIRKHAPQFREPGNGYVLNGILSPFAEDKAQLSFQPTKPLPLLRRFPLPNLNSRSKLSTTRVCFFWVTFYAYQRLLQRSGPTRVFLHVGASNFGTISSARREVMTCCDQQVPGMRVAPYRTLGRLKKSKCWPRQRRLVVKRGRGSLRPVMPLRRAACADVQVCDAKTPQIVSHRANKFRINLALFPPVIASVMHHPTFELRLAEQMVRCGLVARPNMWSKLVGWQE